MYAGVPLISPVRLRRSPVRAAEADSSSPAARSSSVAVKGSGSSILASPKSATQIRPSSRRRTLSGLKSRIGSKRL
jgi:hypothetical protein